jgi:transposase
VSGRAMLAASVTGERDHGVVAELANGRLRKMIPELREALRGRFKEHHALRIHLVLDHTACLETAIAALDTQVEAVMAPSAEARDHLDTITGVGKRAAEVIIAEIGADMSACPAAGHLASWAGKAPGSNITGGKRRSGTTTKGDVCMADILTVRPGCSPLPRHLSVGSVLASEQAARNETSDRRGGHRLASPHQQL